MEMETIPIEDEIQKCKSALKEKEKELHDVKKKLAETEKELETLKSTSCTCTTSQPGKECLKSLFLYIALTFNLFLNQI